MKPNKKIFLNSCKLGVALFGLTLVGCGGGSSNSGGGNKQPVGAQLVSIDQMATIPVINGGNTSGSLYLRNYSDELISDLNLKVDDETAAINTFKINPDDCKQIPAHGFCAVKFNISSLKQGDKGNSLLTLNYKSSSGNFKTMQVVNYEYYALDAKNAGVHFTDSLAINASYGATKHVVGFLVGNGEAGKKYSNVKLNYNSNQIKAVNGFIQGQEIGVGMVVPIELEIKVDDTSHKTLKVTPTYDNQLSKSRSAAPNDVGTDMIISLTPQVSAPNLVIGKLAIIDLTESTNPNTVSVYITNNGNASVTGVSIAAESVVQINNGCKAFELKANATNSCKVEFAIPRGSQPGETLVTYTMDDIQESGTVFQDNLVWFNDKNYPAISLEPIQLFKDLVEESSESIVFKVVNRGNSALENVSIVPNISATSDKFTLISDTCRESNAIAGRKSCTLIANIKAGNSLGDGRSAYLKVSGTSLNKEYNFISLPVKYNVIGARIEISPDTQSFQIFDDGQESQNSIITIKNVGSAIANIQESFALGATKLLKFDTIGVESPCANTLAKEASCKLRVTYGPAAAKQIESGTTQLNIFYDSGSGSPKWVKSFSINYATVSKDSSVRVNVEPINITSGSGIESNHYIATGASNQDQGVKITYISNATFLTLKSFNIDLNSLPIGLTLKANTCPTPDNPGSLAPGASCTLELIVNKYYLTTQGAFSNFGNGIAYPSASWQTDKGFVKQVDIIDNNNSTKFYLDYKQAQITATIEPNNGNFESAILTLNPTNYEGYSNLQVDVSSVSKYLESAPIALTLGCQVNNTDYSVTCNFTNKAGESFSAQKVAYLMPTYLKPGSKADILLDFTSAQSIYLNPSFMYINYEKTPWIVQYGASKDGVGSNTIGYSSFIDKYGNIYVAGSTSSIPIYESQLIGYTDYFFAKYDINGKLLYARESGIINSQMAASAISVNKNGDIFITGNVAYGRDANGWQGYMYITKYNSMGEWQWTNHLGKQNIGNSNATIGLGVATDSSGNAYIAGYTDIPITEKFSQQGVNDYFIAKYRTDGTLEWIDQVGSPGGNTYGFGVSVNRLGSIYIGGYTDIGISGQAKVGNNDYFIVKYTESGAKIWTIQIGTPNGSAFVNGIAADNLDNVYAIGYTDKGVSDQTQSGILDCLVAKHQGSNGLLLWARQKGVASRFTSCDAGAIDNNNNLYVAGQTQVEPHEYYYSLTLKYSSDGVLNWAKQLGNLGGSGSGTKGLGISVDDGGTAYVVGITDIALPGKSMFGSMDYFIAQTVGQ